MRYFFDINTDGATAVDDEGVDLANVEDAQAEAIRSICDLSKELIKSRELASFAITVRDSRGKLMTTSLDVRVERHRLD
jgi:hypothetical protein